MPKARSHLRVMACAPLVAVAMSLVSVPQPSPAEAATDQTVSSGGDWSVDEVAGGYRVTLDLTDPLPVVDDLPMLRVDGRAIGIARESADGRSLSVVTALPSVASADLVELAWASGTPEKSEPTSQAVTMTAPPIRPAVRRAAAGAGVVGPHAYRTDDYDFGDRAVAMDGLGGVRGELRGRIYLPDAATAPGPRPTVVLLHGRHTVCWNLSASGSGAMTWPCAAGQVEVPSYRGYDALAQTLATWGYAVVSVSANAVNANDARLAVDAGALARGRLVMDTLGMLELATSGQPVAHRDEASGLEATLDVALDADTTSLGGSPDADQLDPSDLVGRFDLQKVGLVGHSRGGEGVAAAVALNLESGRPYGIVSTVLLAPVDFARRTLADVETLVVLPYCDGDVADQQGQHYVDDARYAFGDQVLRTTAWVMGANHNFFNSVWTPGGYPFATSDDWWYLDDPACGTAAPSSSRLSATDQRDWSAAYLGAWFRLTLGEPDPALLPLFDGSGPPVLAGAPTADVRVVAHAPSSLRRDVTTFTTYDEDVRTTGLGTLQYCSGADVGGFTLPQLLSPCATASGTRLAAAMPHWTPADFAVDVPSSPMGRFQWTAVDGLWAGSVRVTLPAGERDASSYDALVLKTAPSEGVTRGTDMRVTLVDGRGRTWSKRVSELNPRALSRMPSSPGVPWLDKIVLQQVWIPVGGITGIDTRDIREIRMRGAVGADGTTSGGAYLSDLAWVRSELPQPLVAAERPTVSVVDARVEEGAAPGFRKVAVVLDRPSSTPVSGHVTVTTWLGDAAKVPVSLRRVLFDPGQTCTAVSLPVAGDLIPSATAADASSSYPAVVTSDREAVPGRANMGSVVVREDDGLLLGTPLPPFGIQGDPCAELEAAGQVFPLDVPDHELAVGDSATVVGSGFRVGESVALTDADSAEPLGSVLAGPDGVARFELPVTDTLVGRATVVARGAGSGRQASGELVVRAPTRTSVTMSPQAPEAAEPVVLVARVDGALEGQVDFFDGTSLLASVPLSEGVASWALEDGFAVGDHTVTASYRGSATAKPSESGALAFSLARGVTTTVLSLPGPTPYGRAASGNVVVDGARGGTVRLSAAGLDLDVPLTGGAGSFTLPATWRPGSHRLVAAYSGSDLSTASVTSATHKVLKAVPRLRARLRGSRDGQLVLGVRLSGETAARPPSGAVMVAVGGQRRWVRLVGGRRVRVTVPLRSRGFPVSVSYRGDARYRSASWAVNPDSGR